MAMALCLTLEQLQADLDLCLNEYNEKKNLPVQVVLRKNSDANVYRYHPVA